MLLDKAGTYVGPNEPAIAEGMRVRLLSVAAACAALATLILVALWLQNTQSPCLTVQSPLSQRVVAMRALLADGEYWLGVQPRVTRVWSLKITVSPQTPDPQRALGDADQIAMLASDQPYIEQDVAQLRQAYQTLELHAAQAAALARRIRLLGGSAAPSTAALSDTPNYAPMASWLHMIGEELQALAEPAPASVPEAIPGGS